MKKTVVMLIYFFVFGFILSGCMQSASGYIDELRENKWKAELDGGAEVELSFEDDFASLKINNGGESADISGRCIIDDKSFVIFVPEISQNYGFDYVPNGDTLELSFDGNTIILDKN